jgi:hypothetical protein
MQLACSFAKITQTFNDRSLTSLSRAVNLKIVPGLARLWNSPYSACSIAYYILLPSMSSGFSLHKGGRIARRDEGGGEANSSIYMMET